MVDYLIGEELSEDYFVVEAYSKKNKTKPFEVVASYDLKKIDDKYSSILAEIELEKQISGIFNKYWDDNYLDAMVHTIGYKVDYREAKSLSEYLTLSDSIDTFQVYIKTKGEINKEEEAEKILNFYEEYKMLGTKPATGIFYYIKEEVFNKMIEEYYTIKDRYEYYTREVNSFNNAIIGGEKQDILSKEVILESFEK